MLAWRWPAVFARVTAGLLFGMAGVHRVFMMTPRVRARKLFLKLYRDFSLPVIVATPWDSVSWVDRWVRCLPLAIVVTYGHALLEPLFRVNSHMFPSLILLLPTLALGRGSAFLAG
jgi:hypothetical protein